MSGQDLEQLPQSGVQGLDPALYGIQQLVVDFSQVERMHWLAGTEQHESDTDHTIAVTLLCWYILEKHNLDLDQAKVLKYAITHDLVEARAGDVNAFASNTEREQKAKSEAAALEEISDEFVSFGGLVQTMRNYDAKKDDEAVFVWMVDKIQALLMAEMDEWRPYRTYGVNYDAFCEKYQDMLNRGLPYAREIFEAMIDYFTVNYYDQPPVPVSLQLEQFIPPACAGCETAFSVCADAARRIKQKGSDFDLDQEGSVVSAIISENCTGQYVRSSGWATTKKVCGMADI